MYLRSFQDGDGDGVGDLVGLTERLAYLRRLGIDAIWLSPIFRSPMKDFGYDIADYRSIDPLFGDMDDFDRLLEQAHAQGLKVLLDFVPNHTSDQHEWFLDSAASRTSSRRDWYIWRDPAPDGGPPNNWLSNFGGSAWHWHEPTEQYYYHAFLESQPDLNWRNEAVREAMHDVLRFWLDKGVDGFRIDVIWHLIKDEAFRDNLPNPAYRPGQPEIDRNLQVYSADRPEVHEVITGIRRVVDAYDDRLLIGEIYLPVERLMKYYGDQGTGVDLPFNFQLLQCPWRPRVIATTIEEYEAALPPGGWPNWVLSNHDQPRIAARVGARQARVAALLLLTLRGTPTLYYGDELGIARVDIPADRVRDPWAIREPETGFNRDQARTPMQWSSASHAGFSRVEPWLPLTADWRERNVEQYETAHDSIYWIYRRLLALRRREPALQVGRFECLSADESVLVYMRALDADCIVAALNFSSDARTVPLPARFAESRVLFSTERPGGTDDGMLQTGRRLELGPDEALLIKAALP